MSLDTILGRRPDESLEAAANRVVDELLAARARNDTMRAVMLGAERKADRIAAERNAAQAQMAADCQAALDKAAAVVAELRAEVARLKAAPALKAWETLRKAIVEITCEEGTDPAETIFDDVRGNLGLSEDEHMALIDEHRARVEALRGAFDEYVDAHEKRS